MTNRTKGILSIVASAFGFAMMAACVRLCDDYGESVPCFEKSFFRNLIAFFIAAFAFVRAPSVGTRPAAGDWLTLVARSVLGTVGIFANFYALSHVTIAEGQTLNKTAPFFTLVLAWLFLGERAGARQFLSVLVAFAGTVLVAKPGFAGADAFPLAMGLLGGVAAGGAYAAVRRLGARNIRPSLIVFIFSAFSCLASVPFTWAHYVPLSFAQLLILSGAGLSAAIGQFGITFAYRFAAPREIAVFDYSNILFTAMFGLLLFDQIPDRLSFIGMVIIIIAAWSLHSATKSTAR